METVFHFVKLDLDRLGCFGGGYRSFTLEPGAASGALGKPSEPPIESVAPAKALNLAGSAAFWVVAC